MAHEKDLTIVILTFNEAIHIARCLKSAQQVAADIFVVDSYSTDTTIAQAESLGARVWQHTFENHAAQFAWALAELPIKTEWVMRVDADEVISPTLATNIGRQLSQATTGVNGFLVRRHVTFMGNPIRHGNFPQWVLKIWRRGEGAIEQRWMDEHMMLKSGRALRIQGDFVDDNLNSVTWWTAKHNAYASREAVDLLNARYAFLPKAAAADTLSDYARAKRWMKNHLYAHLPLGLRALAYFLYRMTFQLGILDGRNGFAFHLLQGFWYRYLVDTKVREVTQAMKREHIDCVAAIHKVLGIRL
ncbi:MAG TPA: glycosyltransferase family 2 protein [Castellaniella sp.]|uniref:glycosyltransferase family 2 protein n=1 Tax=Castellaniella sp. TaxID=1955812 RepID=UPI002F07EDDC